MSLTINHQTNDISATSGSVTIDGSAVGGGGGSWNLISTTTVSSSASAVNFTGMSNGTYYKVVLAGVKSSSGVPVVYLRVSRNSAIKTGAEYKYVLDTYTAGSSTISTSSSSGATHFPIGNASSATGGGSQTELFIYNTTANRSTLFCRSIYADSNSNSSARLLFGTDYTDTSNGLDGLSFLLSSGTIEAGTFSLYNLVTS